MVKSHYDADYYSSFRSESAGAAAKILEFLYPAHPFQSVVDIGCGSATWLTAAKNLIEKMGKAPYLVGIDGAYAKHIVPSDVAQFIFVDLELPLQFTQKFDLALCLEVAEHLTSSRAGSLVHDLCQASDTVVFSAAIPGQGGTDHINEQYQEYWHTLFSSEGYIAIDAFKQAFWNDPLFARCPYYASNSLIYTKDRTLAARLNCPIVPIGHWSLRSVHPNIFYDNSFEAAGFAKVCAFAPSKFRRAVSNKLKAAFKNKGEP